MAAAKSGGSKKVMDVMTPGQTKPSSSSRPVIIGNRPILGNDPMVVADAPADQPVQGETPSAPALEESQEREKAAVIASHQARVIVPLTEVTAPAKSSEEPKEADAPTDGTVSDKESDEPTPAEPEKPAEEATPAKIETAADADKSAVPPEDSKEAEDDSADADAPAADSEDSDSGSTEDPESAKSDEDDDDDAEATTASNENPKTAKKIASEADAKRRLELDDLIASGKFALPINAVRRKRSRAILITLIVVVVLAAVVLDGLLDAGLLHLAGVPHTNLISSH